MIPELDMSHGGGRMLVTIMREVIAREVVSIEVPESAGQEAALEFVQAALKADQKIRWSLDMTEARRSPSVSVLNILELTEPRLVPDDGEIPF